MDYRRHCPRQLTRLLVQYGNDFRFTTVGDNRDGAIRCAQIDAANVCGIVYVMHSRSAFSDRTPPLLSSLNEKRRGKISMRSLRGGKHLCERVALLCNFEDENYLGVRL